MQFVCIVKVLCLNLRGSFNCAVPFYLLQFDEVLFVLQILRNKRL